MNNTPDPHEELARRVAGYITGETPWKPFDRVLSQEEQIELYNRGCGLTYADFDYLDSPADNLSQGDTDFTLPDAWAMPPEHQKPFLIGGPRGPFFDQPEADTPHVVGD